MYTSYKERIIIYIIGMPFVPDRFVDLFNMRTSINHFLRLINCTFGRRKRERDREKKVKGKSDVLGHIFFVAIVKFYFVRSSISLYILCIYYIYSLCGGQKGDGELQWLIFGPAMAWNMAERNYWFRTYFVCLAGISLLISTKNNPDN